jgi:hypothetical protein
MRRERPADSQRAVSGAGYLGGPGVGPTRSRNPVNSWMGRWLPLIEDSPAGGPLHLHPCPKLGAPRAGPGPTTQLGDGLRIRPGHPESEGPGRRAPGLPAPHWCARAAAAPARRPGVSGEAPSLRRHTGDSGRPGRLRGTPKTLLHFPAPRAGKAIHPRIVVLNRLKGFDGSPGIQKYTDPTTTPDALMPKGSVSQASGISSFV